MEYDSRAQIAVDRRDKRIAELEAEVERLRDAIRTVYGDSGLEEVERKAALEGEQT